MSSDPAYIILKGHIACPLQCTEAKLLQLSRRRDSPIVPIQWAQSALRSVAESQYHFLLQQCVCTLFGLKWEKLLVSLTLTPSVTPCARAGMWPADLSNNRKQSFSPLDLDFATCKSHYFGVILGTYSDTFPKGCTHFSWRFSLLWEGNQVATPTIHPTEIPEGERLTTIMGFLTFLWPNNDAVIVRFVWIVTLKNVVKTTRSLWSFGEISRKFYGFLWVEERHNCFSPLHIYTCLFPSWDFPSQLLYKELITDQCIPLFNSTA